MQRHRQVLLLHRSGRNLQFVGWRRQPVSPIRFHVSNRFLQLVDIATVVRSRILRIWYSLPLTVRSWRLPSIPELGVNMLL